MKVLFTVLMFVGFVNVSNAQQRESPIERWFVIENNRIVPVISMDNHTLVNLILDSSVEKDTFKICHSSPIDIWINNSLFYHQLQSPCNKYKVSDLMQMVGKDSIVLSIAYERYAVIEASLITSGKEEEALTNERSPNLISQFYLEALLILLFATAVLKYFFPAKFEKLFSNPLASRSSSDIDEFYTGFWDLENLITTLVFSLVTAIQIIYIQEKFSIWPYLNTWSDNYFIQWLFISGMIFLFLVVKYLFSWMMSLLMQTRVLPNIQFQDFIQVFMWISMASLVFFFVDLYLITKTSYSLVNLAYILSIIVLISFQLWLYFKFVKFYSHKKLLIISYLCTTEFLPVFLIIFWLVK